MSRGESFRKGNPRFRQMGVVSGSVLLGAFLWSGELLAVAPPGGGAPGSVASPHASSAPPRLLTRADADERARLELLGKALGDFFVEMDSQTGAPARLLLAGIEVPGSVEREGVAVAHALALLPSLLPALSPGRGLVDFVLMTDHLDSVSGIRTLAFAQLVHGRQLESPAGLATISLRYKHGRLVAIANESLPIASPGYVQGIVPSSGLGVLALGLEAAASSKGGRLRVERVDEALWFVPRRDGKVSARLVAPVVVRHLDGAELVRLLVDLRSGELVDRRSELFFGSSPLRYDVPERWPEGGRMNAPVTDAQISTSDGGSQVTGADGVVDYLDNGVNFSHALTGPYARIENASGELLVMGAPLTSGQPFVGGFPSAELADAQLSGFIHTNLVKARMRIIAPGFDFLDEQLLVSVNQEQTCNAYWDGDSINFFVEGDGCANTARLGDVVYHEYGHGVHQNAIIPGVGSMSVSLSEGISDYLAATIVNDSGMARGFFLGSDEPLRELDPVDWEWSWPEDIGEVHDEGRIIGGSFWDLRSQLSDKYGAVTGVALTDRLWFQAIQRASDIPTAYFETLIADDDDGDLTNGTPNVCEINAAFGTHGLFQVPGVAESLTIVDGDPLRVRMELAFPYPQCGTSAESFVSWRDREDPSEVGTAQMVALGNDLWQAEIPRPEDGSVLQWAIDLDWNVGTKEHHPHNLVDPWYEMYIGPLVPLYCTSFEDGFAQWTIDSDTWEVGTSSSGSAGGDPSGAYDENWWVGTGLTGTGMYPSSQFSSLISPLIDTVGYPTVRLQYWRDLDVEDAIFDQASISADGVELWSNFASADDWAATRHHRDASWRFHDVDISAQSEDGQVQVEFALASDGGLQFGGWNIDKLCIVGVSGVVCGNGIVEGLEECDDGNLEDGDGCSSLCLVEEEPGDDDGSDESEAGTGFGDELGAAPVAPRGCDCQSSEQDGFGALGIFGFGLLAWRRRRRLH